MFEAQSPTAARKVDPGQTGGGSLLETCRLWPNLGRTGPDRPLFAGTQSVQLSQDVGVTLQKPGNKDRKQEDYNTLDDYYCCHQVLLAQANGMPLESPKVNVDSAGPEESALRIDHVPASNQPTPEAPLPFQSPGTG